MYRIIQKRNFFFILSGLLLVPGLISLFIWGLPLGIDFTGGTLLRVEFAATRPDSQSVENTVKDMDLGTTVIQPLGQNEMTIRMKNIDNATKDEILSKLTEQFGNVQEKSFESIGPTLGKELQHRAVIAIILVLIFIVLYISFAFRKVSAGPVPSWVYGACAVVALVHDVFIVIGVFSLLGRFFHVQVDSLFVSALLTVLGFSVHDTIVVFDRIREQLLTSHGEPFEEIVNRSVNQTLVRSLSTSFTTLLVLLALLAFGGDTTRHFILALIIGITAGTYSSIFVASPLLVVWNSWRRK